MTWSIKPTAAAAADRSTGIVADIRVRREWASQTLWCSASASLRRSHADANRDTCAARTLPGSGATPAAESEIVASAGDQEAVLVHSFDLAAMRKQRAGWGLFRDRRPDLYATLMTLDGQCWTD